MESVSVAHLPCKISANAIFPPDDNVGNVVPNDAGW